MVKLERTHCWYRPYQVVASGKTYLLEDIKFYNSEGVVVSAGSGWLQNARGVDIQSVELPVDKVTRRNKEKFDGEVFGCVFHTSLGESHLVLYIPMEMLNIQYQTKKKMYGDRVYECYTGDQDIYLTKYVKSLDDGLRVIKNKYGDVQDKVSVYDLERNPDEVLDRLNQLISLVAEFKEERAKIDSIVVEG